VDGWAVERNLLSFGFFSVLDYPVATQQRSILETSGLDKALWLAWMAIAKLS
jgi:hypothetical protein